MASFLAAPFPRSFCKVTPPWCPWRFRDPSFLAFGSGPLDVTPQSRRCGGYPAEACPAWTTVTRTSMWMCSRPLFHDWHTGTGHCQSEPQCGWPHSEHICCSHHMQSHVFSYLCILTVSRTGPIPSAASISHAATPAPSRQRFPPTPLEFRGHTHGVGGVSRVATSPPCCSW